MLDVVSLRKDLDVVVQSLEKRKSPQRFDNDAPRGVKPWVRIVALSVAFAMILSVLIGALSAAEF